MKCTTCESEIEPDKLITCKTCKNPYHLDCTDLKKGLRGRPATAKWDCQVCRDNKDTGSDMSGDDDGNSQFKKLEIMIASLTTSIGKIKLSTDEIPGIQQALNHQSDQYDEILKNQETQAKDIKELTKKVESLKEEKLQQQKIISDLQNKICELEQNQLNKNIEITNVKKINNENVKDTVEKIAKALNLSDTVPEIEHVYRANTNRTDRDPKLVICFRSGAARNAWLERKRECKNLTSDSVFQDANKTTKIYVNEHMSPYYKKLFYQAKEKAREQNWKFVWIKNGKIFARSNETMSIIRINNEGDLARKMV
jgi:Baculovirus FP protein/PHD-finger